MTDPPGIPRRTVLGCAAACALAASAGCSAGRAEDPAPFTAAATDIPVGGGVVYAERSTIITQPNPGEFQAFSTACPHQGCAVTEIRDGQLVCPCHGSRFRLADGSVERGPARDALSRRAIQVSGTDLRIT
ncbi:Rieske (2Fe-2S) protein [Nocardia huaxiensis]|uniref:Cytochrome bc1 complex Rieske iron-sulfur subunit n=1 Tax=Nocardia huaxiensis TaxID=2755382 RepID=A0A7D6ZHS5_9NOCA|nr:Rieske (2Fe-2S) protein [Nocardia huaxiensis]QLY33918.1 Rieske (2Fe-2S) protein [Nocardia huaxiensis]UFS99145.1 Rieske (2Fe-2S) protein [Nocardia huaxiensis]